MVISKNRDVEPNAVQNQPASSVDTDKKYTDDVILDNIENNIHHQKTIGDFIGNKAHLDTDKHSTHMIAQIYLEANKTIENILAHNPADPDITAFVKKLGEQLDYVFKNNLLPYIESVKNLRYIKKAGKDGDMKEADDVIFYKELRKNLNILYTNCLRKLGEEHILTIKLKQIENTLMHYTGGNLNYTDHNLVDESNSDQQFENFKRKSIKWLDVSDLPLFSHDPSPADVKQGNIGDCWFLASLASTASNNPEIIKNAMKDDGNGNVIVRLYKQGYENHADLPHGEIERRVNNMRNQAANISAEISQFFHHTSDLARLLRRFFSIYDRRGCNIDLLYEKTKDQLHNLWDAAAQANFKIEDFLPELCALNTIIEQEHPAYDENGNPLFFKYFEPGKENNFIPVYYKIKKTIPYTTGFFEKNIVGARESSLWVLMLEKALTIHAKECTKNNHVSKNKTINKRNLNYSSIDGGNIAWLFQNASFDNATTLLSGDIGGKDIFGGYSHKNNIINNGKKKSFLGTYDVFILGFKDFFYDDDEKYLNMFRNALKKEDNNIDKNGGRLSLDFLKDFIDKTTIQGLDDSGDVLTDPDEIKERKQELYDKFKELADSNEIQLNYKPFSGRYTDHALAMYDKIKQNLKNNIPVTAGTIKTDKKGLGLNDEGLRDGVAGEHGYSVLGAEEENGIKYVIVRNPWGDYTREYSEDRSKSKAVWKNDLGVMKLELNDFMNEFENLYYNKKVLDCLNDEEYLDRVQCIIQDMQTLRTRRLEK